MIKVTDDTYENFIKKGNKIKILKLGATWCSPCQMAIPPCNELDKELENESVSSSTSTVHFYFF